MLTDILCNILTYLLDLLNKFDEDDKNTTEYIQKDINSVAHCSEIMQMNLNIDKCHSLHMGSNNTHLHYTIPRLCDTILAPTLTHSTS